jgi:hypothetical protein
MKTDEALAVQPMTTPADLLRIAVSQNADLDKMSKLMDLQERWQAAEAKRAFDEAKAKFSAFAIQVTKDKINKQYDSKYTSLGNLVNIVTPFLAQCDLNARWEIDQSNGIKVTCVLAHKAGHTERTAMTVPPDASGAKNVIQQIKSSITYAKACTFESVCGLASTDANLDDDGNSLSGGEVDANLQRIMDTKTGDELKHVFKEVYEEAEKAKAKGAMAAYIKARASRIEQARQEKAQTTEPTSEPQKVTTSPVKPVSDHNWAKLHASAKDRGIEHEEIASYYRKRFKVEHGRDLTPVQFKLVCDEVATWRGPEIV